MNIAGSHTLFDKIETQSSEIKSLDTKHTETKSAEVESLASESVRVHQQAPASTARSEVDADVPALIALFNTTFKDFNTRLVLGDNEPVYLPAGSGKPYHQIVFAHGFFSSALHEVAHWCIAGEKRRLLEDYGYWYCPDGRDAAQQADFEKVEIKPQAIEWAFTEAAGRKFQVSTDNLDGAEPDREGFTRSVAAQLKCYKTEGFPPRAERFIQALSSVFGKSKLSASPCSTAGNAPTDFERSETRSGIGVVAE